MKHLLTYKIQQGQNFVIWIFFNKIQSKNVIRCKECDEEFSLTGTRTTLVTHLKEKHYQNKGTGFYYSYQNYMDHLTQALHYERHNFSEVQKKNLKLSFGTRYKENFTLLLKYAGIEIDCAKCQQDLFHH